MCFENSLFSPESMCVYKQQWRNYIKPGFFLNAGDPYANYDLALQEDKISNLTPGITSDALYPHTQINAMPGNLFIKYFMLILCMHHVMVH